MLPRSNNPLVAGKRFLAMAVISGALALAGPAPAEAQRVAVVNDAEIEALVRDYVTPILKAAGLSRSGIEIVLVNDSSFNAFVLGRRIFMNTGAIMTAETPNEIIGVLAHEAGHIAGGHQQRMRDQLERARNLAVLSAVLGVGAMVAGGASGEGSLAQAGSGVIAGGAEAARRSLLAYQRTEEVTADRAAVKYLDATGQSAAGMLATFQRFQGALSLSGVKVDPYSISHPLPRDRILNLQQLAQSSPNFSKKDSPALQARHDMARAKIAAYTAGPAAVARLFRDDRGNIGYQYGDAITAMLRGSTRDAIRKVDALLAKQPKNPYFHELRGDVMIKANNPAEAAKSYSVALKGSKSPVIQIQLGRALLAAGGEANIKRGVSELAQATSSNPSDPTGYFYLAQAYGRLGRDGEAELAMAEHHFRSGNVRDAKIFAARSQQKFKPGSPEWLRADDILKQKEPKKK